MVGAITPWNLPFDLFVWAVIPNLLVGNTVVFKISEECPLCGKLFEKIMDQSGLPKGVFNEIYGNGKVGEMLINQEIDLVWFTGSSKVGKKLYEICGQKFIKAVLELGGSNPGIVFEDVSVDKIVDKLYSKRFGFCGQTCDALKRLLVQESIYEEVVEKLTKRVEKTIVGQPEEEKTDMGPLVAKRQLDLLKDLVADALKKGAKIITGGKEPADLKGAYYLPTILTNIKDNMRVWKEEVFGPVLAIRKFKTEAEAIKLANDSVYGLGSVGIYQ
ncbi:MAG: aldehyde dehydrogenase family protein [Patescibacteria group bacterium]|nr:aldehyde dehydrogenase family protein [Patescibacteria group bacterium]